MGEVAEPRIPEWLAPQLDRGAYEGETYQQIGATLSSLIERFRLSFPQDWDQLRLCPLQHGVDTMVETLRQPRPGYRT
ncbi:MAG: hypothetical protein ACXWUN_10600 [Allosphingosinicella sp.]